MTFSPYSLFTVILLISLFISVFATAANCIGIVRRIPLAAVYVFLAAVGLRLLMPFEIDRLSVEVNSYNVMTRINDFMRNEIFTMGSISFNVGSLLVFVWITGIIVRSVFLIAKYCYFRFIIRQLVEVQDEHILDTVDLICSKLSIKSKPKVIRIMSDCSPSEYGLFKQTIVLNNKEYTNEELYYILLHEITHHKLKNDAAKLFVKILEIIFWWNPAVYLLYDQIDKLMEIYTDLSVTKNFTKAQKYAYLSCLCNVYKTININSISSSAFASPVIGRAKESEIKKRFKVVALGAKANVSKYISMIVIVFCCYLTFGIVFQPAYEPSENEMMPTNVEGSDMYIINEDNIYVLYCNDEAIVASPNIEDLKPFLNNEEE